ncbi:uncharacterized protein OCT59_000394 [Rhizophagus irregularis]|uniref:uncharacterized protein n=1 Tax=Rhizophagus irregularis TaxID=588596 RepID=UPI000CAF392B|nr:hypothetical protein OCT59_000394 [Rhizophagus irregularis]GBC47691.1 hypothetical protein GLOIN_2v1785889 [Rhizophagus irregularis DAOM 181602=DAOM 197198]GBC47708.1 hypothetical protein GLOIN_2v1785889 [Rhizophagus irregularis DAOM 181602=DAOM 197198]
MTYTVEKLAGIFSYTVPDLTGINREILKSHQNPHAVSVIPKLVCHILECIPSSNFGPHLLEVNPIWSAEAERVLWKRYKEAKEEYDRAVDYYREAIDNFIEADQKKYTRFAGMVAVEKALLRCSFIMQESDWEKWTQITYNIQLLKEGRTPDDSDDESDNGEVSLDDSDDEEYF